MIPRDGRRKGVLKDEQGLQGWKWDWAFVRRKQDGLYPLAHLRFLLPFNAE